MADIYIHIVDDGSESVYPEERIPELLQQGVLTPDAYYWREGMTKWRRLSKFRPAVRAIVPERRTDRLPSLSGKPVVTEHESTLLPGLSEKPILTEHESILLPDLVEKPIRMEHDSTFLPGLSERPARMERDAPASGTRTFGTSRRFRFRRRPELLTLVVQLFLVAALLLTAAELVLAVLDLKSSGIASLAMPGAGSRTHLRHALGWAGLGLNFILFIFYCQWIYRANLNCHSFSSIVTFTSRWAVWCHLIPVINLIRPYQAMQEIWKVSNNPRLWQNDSGSMLVGLWWTFWLLTLILAETCYLLTDLAGTRTEFTAAALVFLALKAAQLIWYGLFFAMISLIIRKQVQLVQSRSDRPRP